MESEAKVLPSSFVTMDMYYLVKTPVFMIVFLYFCPQRYYLFAK